MAASRIRPTSVLFAAALLAALAIISNAYLSLNSAERLAAVYLAKVLLASLTMAFLMAFQLRWVITKYDLSVLDFYTRWKFFKQSIAVGAGILLLSIAFLLDFGQYAGRIQGQDYSLVINSLEVMSLIFFGHSYYRLARLQGV